MTDKEKSLTYDTLWGKSSPTMTADKDLDLILGSVTHLPVKYWRKNFFFKGGLNSTFKTMTQGKFPAGANTKGTHPVFALKPLAHGAGFEVCPCSSSAWKKLTWINKGTQLLYTKEIMEKTSYLLEHIPFNIPASESIKLRFMGEVIAHDIHSIKKGAEHGNR